MDDRTDRAHYAIERKLGPLPREATVWDKIEDEHFPECPTAIAARKHLPSTCCMCPELEIANKSAEDEIEANDRYMEKGR